MTAVTAAPSALTSALTLRQVHPVRASLLGAAVVFAVSSLAMGATYYFSRAALIEGVQRELLQVAKVAAAGVDGDLHRGLTSPGQDGGQDYMRVARPLAALQRVADDVFYLYTLVPTSHGIVHGVDAATLYRKPGDTSERLVLAEPYEADDPDLQHALATRQPFVSRESWTEPGRRFMSAYAPFFDSSGALVGAVEADMWVRALDDRLSGLLAIVRVAMLGIVVMSICAGLVLYRLNATAAALARRDGETARELAAARDAAEQSSRGKSAFLAMMSHELRTPLNAIIGYGEMLQQEFADRDDATMSRDAGRIVQAGRHLTAMIGDILDYSKLEAGRLVITRVPMDVAALCEEVRATLAPEAAAKGVDLRVVVDRRAATVLADPVRLRQVLLTLAGNGVRYTAKGHVTLRLRPAPGRPGRLVCAVHDTGPGLPAFVRARLFQSFAEVGRPEERSQGAGLGLLIARRLTEAMAGSLRVRSRDGHGSTFRVALDGLMPPVAKVA
ncbi:MAG: sensor histidine kinase [Vicinamibacterales bacterium]